MKEESKNFRYWTLFIYCQHYYKTVHYWCTMVLDATSSFLHKYIADGWVSNACEIKPCLLFSM